VVKNNPQYDKLLLFKKSQKFLDKVLFVLFAEDKGLVATNSIVQIVEKWNDLKNDAFDTPKPLYELIALFFSNLFIGKKDQKGGVLIPEFGGEIFAPDEVLDTLLVDDEVLQDDLLKLSKYDFNTDVDVNILGHIFEHSLSEIEEVEAELKGEAADKTKGKRKKDGVFYTPKYITKYIVENTVGKLCSEKKTELKLDVDIAIFEHQKADGKLNAKGIALFETLSQYKDWLLTLKILDPACGSGAFLNQAVNFLVQEHKFADDIIAELTNSPLRLFDTDIAILENNIYGVDINEESIEIAKLSLWLRTAQQGRKLSNLSNNIKCGNSLIDDPAVAGDKAFNWQNEFPEVFAKGGFDVVIGNPPYVRQELFKEIKPYLEKQYKCYNSIADLYTYFIEKGIQLMNSNGVFSYILPNKFIKANYGKEIRKVIYENAHLELLFDFDDFPVFDEATTYPLIFIIKKQSKNNFVNVSSINKRLINKNPIGELIQNTRLIEFKNFTKDEWQFEEQTSSILLEKIKENSIRLEDLVNGKVLYGIKTGCNDAFLINQNEYDTLSSKNIFKAVAGREVKRYKLEFDEKYMIYNDWYYDINSDKQLRDFLSLKKEILENRAEVKEKKYPWWSLSRYGSNNAKLLFEPKIIYPRINNQCNFYFDEKGDHLITDNNFYISTDKKYLLPILNSKLTFYFISRNAPTLQGGYYDFRRDYVIDLPIKIIDKRFEKELSAYTDKMQLLNFTSYNNSKKFIQFFTNQNQLQKLSTKLSNWQELSFPEFIKELNKGIKVTKGIPLSKKDEFEWMELFEENKKKALELKSHIENTDKEIDQLVYALYELTEDEIKIVEGS